MGRRHQQGWSKLTLPTDAAHRPCSGIVIGDSRLVHIGLREEGGFIGHARSASRHPVPEHISAKHADLALSLAGLFGNSISRRPWFRSASRFGGSLRCLRIRRTSTRSRMATAVFTASSCIMSLPSARLPPWGLIFPISTVILDDIVRYQDVLQAGSRNRLLRFIPWTATSSGNVAVLNDTSDFYRYFDATPHCEFLFDCIERAVSQELARRACVSRTSGRLSSGRHGSPRHGRAQA